MTTPLLKTRFCPSPTGLLHLGNIRTALFNVLLARGQHGVFLLRIEDTDKARSETRYADALQQDMHWLGLSWDEGPGCEKNAGPYFQSQRQAVYDTYYQRLEEQDKAYPCFCTEQQLALARKLQRAAGKPPRYSGVCRDLTAEQVAEKLSQGLKPTLRFRVPLEDETTFMDLVRGAQRFKNSDIGDFIIRRADGTPPFMYCNAIDDALMGVTHALRGEDHLTNTPRQIMILHALDLPIPQYGHIALIVGPDGSPLSKRHGSRSLEALREQGYLPIAVNNYLGRLGHHYVEEQLMTLSELADHFSLKALGTAPARFDANQLLYWQRQALISLSDADFWQWLGEPVQQLIPTASRELFIQAIRPNITFPTEASHWANRLFSEDWDYDTEQQHILREVDPRFFSEITETIQSQGANLSAVTNALRDRLQLKGKALFQPLRVALTGELHGPELLQIFELLGPEQLQNRMHKALALVTS